MLGIRTPKKDRNADMEKRESPKGSESEDRVYQEPSVRRSVGEWEMGKVDSLPKSHSSTMQAGPQRTKAKPLTSQDVKRRTSTEAPAAADKNRETHTGTKDRVTDARNCLLKAVRSLNEARNLRGDIKMEVTRLLDRLFQIVKEAEYERKGSEGNGTKEVMKNIIPVQEKKIDEEIIITKIEENRKILLENKKTMEEIKEEIQKNRINIEKVTYASVTATATPATLRQPNRTALHSIVVSSKDDLDTGEEVLQKIRQAVDAKEGWIKVERIRKAKDRKIIMGCSTKEERKKVKEKIEKSGKLTVEEMKNKDPLLTLRDVLVLNKDEDVLRAIRNQNRGLFSGVSEGEDRMEIKYRRKARNPHANHVVMSVSPTIWSRALEIGTVHIDLQRVRVADQSPLVQCTRCLDYGHSKRFCKEPADACSHCGEPHLRGECANRIAGEKPACKNCVRAKYEETEHNAFSEACPVRRKWDAIARAAIAYC